MIRVGPVAVAASCGLVLVLTGCSGQLGPPLGVVAPLPVELVLPPSPPIGEPAPPVQRVSSAPSPASTTRSAPARPDLRVVQRQLTQQRYYAGPVTGAPGAALTSAVTAFQKVNGLAVDGVVGPRTQAALAAPRTPVLRDATPANRVEVDLTRQVLYVVQAGRITRILPVSSGNGQTYVQQNGQVARALTPVGRYRIIRRVAGPERAYLGTLYDPQYFYRGWAIHGSDSVPAGPASHGCIRITRWDATWLFGQLSLGWAVSVYGGAFTFPAGSRAAGTDVPTGDTPDGSPAPTSPTPRATASPSPAPTGSPGRPSPSPTVTT